MLNIGFDTETFYSKDFSVTDLGYWKYARDPRFDCYLISVSDGKESWAGHPRDFNFDSLNGNRLVIHNRPFDAEVKLAMEEAGTWPRTTPAELVCTLDMSAYLWNVRSLKDAALVGLGMEMDKGVRDRAKGKRWEDMVAEGWSDDMLRYAGLDPTAAILLWNKYNHLWPDFERRLSDLTFEQGRYGVRLDVAKLDDGVKLMQRVIQTALQNLPWVERGRKPASPIGLHEQCRMEGIPCPPVKVHDPEGAVEWEEMFAPKHKFVMALRNMRKAKKALATLETMKLRLRPDDTIAFSLKYAGAHTLRWAGDGGLNFQNFGKEPLFVGSDGEFSFDTKDLLAAFRKDESMPVGTTYLDMRGLIVARPGTILAPVDLAQIEPRVLNWLAGNFKLLGLVAEGYAIYEAYARAMEGYEGPSIKENDPNYYQYLKVKVLGMGYGAGWEKAIVIGKIYGVDLTEKDEYYAKLAAVDGTFHMRRKGVLKWEYTSAPTGVVVPLVSSKELIDPGTFEQCVFIKKGCYVKGDWREYIVAQPVYGQQARYEVKKFRTDNPDIVALWKTLQTALENAVGGDLVLEGPHGGKLTYRDVKRQVREFTDEDTGEKYLKTVLTAVVAGKRTILHGPKLTENITQWVGRMVFAEGLLRAQESGLRTLFTVHDEAVPEVPLECINDFGAEIVQGEIEKEFSVTPEWLSGCPIGAECTLTLKYKK